MKWTLLLSIVIVGLSGCSLKKAESQSVPHDPLQAELRSQSQELSDSGMINIEETRDGTFVALMWPEFSADEEGTRKFAELGKSLLDMVKQASIDKRKGLDAEIEREFIFGEFIKDQCHQFSIYDPEEYPEGSCDTELVESFDDSLSRNIGSDGIVAAALRAGLSAPPVDATEFEFPTWDAGLELESGECEVPPVWVENPPSSFDEAFEHGWMNAQSADNVELYNKCNGYRSHGAHLNEEAARVSRAGETLDHIKMGINCAEPIRASTKEEMSSNWKQCNKYFMTDQNPGSLPVMPNFQYDLHENWIDTGSEGIGSFIKWQKLDDGSVKVDVSIKVFDGIAFSSNPEEYNANADIYPVEKLSYDAVTRKLTFQLLHPKKQIRYDISATQFVDKDFADQTQFSGEITATCEGTAEECTLYQNGHQERPGMFLFKGLLKGIE